MKAGDQSLRKFTKKLLVTNNQENLCEDLDFFNNNQDSHLIGRTSAVKTHLFTWLRTIHNNYSPFFRAAVNTNPYSQSFIPAARKQKICNRSPSPCRACKVNWRLLYALFEKTSANNHWIQSTPINLVPPFNNFLPTPGDLHKLYGY